MPAPSPAPSSPLPRLSGLDGLRGVAAVAVVVLHVWMYTGANAPDPPQLLDAVIGELRVAVVLFFVLSAFLLVRPWVATAHGERGAPRLGRFVMRRLARVAPAYWVALAGAFLVLQGSGHGRAVGPESLPVFAAFLENFSSGTRGRLDPPMWSLAVEVSFYILLPLVGWVLVRTARAPRRRIGGPLLVCGALVAVQLGWTAAGVAGDWKPEVMWSLPTHVGVFACGVAAAVLAHRRRPGRAVQALLLAGGAALVGVNGVWHSGGTGFVGHVVADLPAAAGFAAIVAAVALRPPGVLSTPVLRGLGAISYGVYLWHMPVLYALQVHDAFPESPARALLAVLVPTLAVAAASWVLVERPVLRLTDRGFRRTARPPLALGGRPVPAMAEAGDMRSAR